MSYPRVGRPRPACPRCATRRPPVQRGCQEQGCVARGAPHAHNRCRDCGFAWIQMRRGQGAGVITKGA